MMTRKLREVLKLAERWPEEAQEELAEAALEIAASLEGQYYASGDEIEGIDRGLEDVRQGRFAAEEEVKEVFSKFRHP
jgi:predicted transcriptional regulator